MSWFSNLIPIVTTGAGALLGGPAGAAVGATLGGGISSAMAVKEANDANISMQRETNSETIDLANTAHQREIADLKAAGLNPILSAKYGGSATPSLGAPSVESAAPVINSSAQGVSTSLLNARNLAADLEVKNSVVQSNSAQAVKAGQEARRQAMENDVLETQLPLRKREAEMRNRRSDSEVGFGTTMSDIFGTAGKLFSGSVNIK